MRTARVPVRLCYSYSTPVSVRATSNPTRTRSRARIVTRPNWSVPVNGGIVWMCRIGLFRRRAICSFTREVMLKLTMDYKMTKHMLNNCTIKESRTWLLVCTRHCYFIPFNREHPVRGRYNPTQATWFWKLLPKCHSLLSVSDVPHKKPKRNRNKTFAAPCMCECVPGPKQLVN